MKICNKCKLEKDNSDFYTMGTGSLYYICKECAINIGKISRKNPEYKRKKRLRDKERRLMDPLYRERTNKQQRESSRRNHIRVMLNNAKKRALKLNIEFNLTKEDIIIPDKCPLLEIPFIVGTKENYLYTPTIDRIDTNKGYVKENIRIITMLANSMKNSATFDQLLTFSKNIKDYIKI